MDNENRTAAAVGRTATRREWIALGVLALRCWLYSMDLTVLNLAVPHLSADLEPGAMTSVGRVQRQSRLGGLLKYYSPAA